MSLLARHPKPRRRSEATTSLLTGSGCISSSSRCSTSTPSILHGAQVHPSPDREGWCCRLRGSRRQSTEGEALALQGWAQGRGRVADNDNAPKRFQTPDVVIKLTRITDPPAGFAGEQRIEKNLALIRLQQDGGELPKVWKHRAAPRGATTRCHDRRTASSRADSPPLSRLGAPARTKPNHPRVTRYHPAMTGGPAT